MTMLTLHHGDQEWEYVEHPVEIARRALNEAADLAWAEGDRDWGGIFARMASSLPDRLPIRKTTAATPKVQA
jgi:hypothetical protein